MWKWGNVEMWKWNSRGMEFENLKIGEFENETANTITAKTPRREGSLRLRGKNLQGHFFYPK